jgi:hypothetical protein
VKSTRAASPNYNLPATEQKVVLIEVAVPRLRARSLLGTFYMPREDGQEKEGRNHRGVLALHELTMKKECQNNRLSGPKVWCRRTFLNDFSDEHFCETCDDLGNRL